MPPHMLPAGPRAKESAWERGLKVSKKIREEVKRNEKSDDDSDDSQPGTKVSVSLFLIVTCGNQGECVILLIVTCGFYYRELLVCIYFKRT